MTDTVKAPGKKKPAWQVVLETVSPTIKRPRRNSFHTLAYVANYADPLEMAKEMEASGEVELYVCPDVRTPICYLKSMKKYPGMITGDRPETWKQLPEFFKKHPFPHIKGFKRFAEDTWTGGGYGKGTMIKANSAMTTAYQGEDFPYAREVIKQLKLAGYTPGITEDDLVEPPPPCPDRAYMAAHPEVEVQAAA